ncbi:hypothetical protein [Roseofilum casamattae]|uniref:Uncharacterized protein n=1 Tax=Roseofilum casamattae BLCC-M143 TaxID=3022442 RepID=A0ABT7BRH0_9CYAN|nr:hypothetical protein [Roseofilum casamattae]MDJ1181795.1 hypothetical protein [Roseofilum casamattae BLCC-M143]
MIAKRIVGRTIALLSEKIDEMGAIGIGRRYVPIALKHTIAIA